MQLIHLFERHLELNFLKLLKDLISFNKDVISIADSHYYPQRCKITALYTGVKHTWKPIQHYSIKVRLDWRKNFLESWLLSRDFIYGMFTLPASLFSQRPVKDCREIMCPEFSCFYSHWRDQLTTSECQDSMFQKCRDYNTSPFGVQRKFEHFSPSKLNRNFIFRAPLEVSAVK